MLTTGDAVPRVVLDPVFGTALDLPDTLAVGPIVVVFVGGLSTPHTRGILAALQDVYGDLDRNGIRLVGVTSSDLDRARDFVPRYHVLFPLVVDPEGTLRQCFGLDTASGMASTLRGLVDEVRHARDIVRLGRGWFEPGASAPPGWFVLGVDGRVATARGKAPDVAELLAAARPTLSPSSA